MAHIQSPAADVDTVSSQGWLSPSQSYRYISSQSRVAIWTCSGWYSASLWSTPWLWAADRWCSSDSLTTSQPGVESHCWRSEHCCPHTRWRWRMSHGLSSAHESSSRFQSVWALSCCDRIVRPSASGHRSQFSRCKSRRTWSYSTIWYPECQRSVRSNISPWISIGKQLTSKSNILIVLSRDAEMNNEGSGWFDNAVTVHEWEFLKLWISFRSSEIFHTKSYPESVDVMKYLNFSDMMRSVT